MNKMTEALMALDKSLAKAKADWDVLEHALIEETNGRISTCELVRPRLQLYTKASESEALEALRELADDACVEISWQDDDATCYKFDIERRPFCIVVNK